MASLNDFEIALTNHETFFAIAYQHNEQVNRLISQRDARKLKDNGDVDFQAAKNAEIQRFAMVSVVFSALTLEAFINNYAMERFSSSYFENHLDKLGAVGKWVVFPRLVTRKEINRDGQAFEGLKGLFRHRDKLVHYKTRKKKVSDLREDKDWVTEEHSQHALRTVKAMIDALSELDPTVETEWLQSAPHDPYA